ncbi:MAG: CotH kinase family protein [Clostridia bacterium]|nr:CotH kinase family protein [Clostridia bacterium]
MKKVVIVSVLILLLVCVFIPATFASGEREVTVELATGERLVSIENKFYLPSGADITAVKIDLNTENSVTYGESNTALTEGATIDLTPFKTVDNYHYECYTVEFTVGSTKESYTFYVADSLSAVFIDTYIGIDNFKIKQQKDSFTKVSILNKDGTYEYKDSEISVTESKVRGNTTPDLYKKPYQMKFENKVDLFGLGEARTWILLANYLDQSYLRNATMFELAQQLGMNASSFVSVDVYIDGYYEGVYLLCEKVQVQSERVDIRDLEKEMKELMGSDYGRGDTTVITTGETVDDTFLTEYKYYNSVITPEDITGGYLIELDNTNKGNRSKMEECYFITDSGNFYVMKSPEVCSKEQMLYIATLFSEMEEAFTSSTGRNSKGKHYSEYMDVDSFAYGYIMCEFGRTYDAGSNSVYFYKDADKDGVQSKIVKGPLWDCDNSLANIVRGNAHLTDNYWAANRTPWNKLTQHEDFMAVVAEKFEGIYDTIYDMADAGGFLDMQVEALGSSIHMDRVRNHLNTKDLWPINTYSNFTGKHYEANTSMIHWFNRPQIPESEWAFPTYVVYSNGFDTDATTVIGNLRTHMTARADWLARQFGCDVTFRTRVDHVYDSDTDDTCNDCGHVREIAGHIYTSNCDASCNICKYERIAHVYDSPCDDTCNECTHTKEASEIHVYDHKCDKECNLCHEERTIEGHKYDHVCDAICNYCGERREASTHTYDNLCDATCNNCKTERYVKGHSGGTATCGEKAVCTTCNQPYGNTLPHTYGTEYVSDGTYHWIECTECKAPRLPKSRHRIAAVYSTDEEHHYRVCTDPNCKAIVDWSVGDHDFENACDKTCSICNLVRDVEHEWGDPEVIKEATGSEKGQIQYTCKKCEATKIEAVEETTGCASGEATLYAFLTNSAILLAWFALKKKS